jgi:hypothetical protein
MTFMQANGYQDLQLINMHYCGKCKKTQHRFGTQVIKTWWYDNWLNEVQEYCGKSGNAYK